MARACLPHRLYKFERTAGSVYSITFVDVNEETAWAFTARGVGHPSASTASEHAMSSSSIIQLELDHDATLHPLQRVHLGLRHSDFCVRANKLQGQLLRERRNGRESDKYVNALHFRTQGPP